MSEFEALIKAATAARENAHARFSNFKVGAALRTAQGKIYGGCNVENATYGLTVCAERVAIFKAISEGDCGGDRHRYTYATVRGVPAIDLGILRGCAGGNGEFKGQK